MKKIFAVSGGIDSIVMLHLFRDDPDIIVAHFDHGIRPNSVEDCIFVEKLAQQYGKEFISKHAKLGSKCSEDNARQARYAFLNEVARQYNGAIYTAHHADDLIETAIINIIRGTGWRGLSVLNNREIVRPLLCWTKKDIYRYATKENLSFRLDQTNSDSRYLRNRVREKLQNASDDDKNRLYSLAIRQREIANEVEKICASVPKDIFPRSLINDCNNVSLEILRTFLAHNGISQTRPQLYRAINAIKNYAPNKRFSLNKQKSLKISKYNCRIVTADCDKE